MNEKNIIEKLDNKYELWKIDDYYQIYKQRVIFLKYKYNNLID